MLDPPRLLLLVVGGITLLLGLVLWGLDMDKRANRAFAALLALKGLSLAISQVPAMFPGATAFVYAVLPYFLLPLVPLGLYFASVFPRRRGPLGRPGGGWWTLGIVATLWLLYLWRHDLFYQLADEAPSHPALVAMGGLSYVSFGPLSLFLWASFPTFGLLALLFVADYARSQHGPQRMSHFLVGVGFMVNAFFDGVRQLVGFVGILRDPAGYPLVPWGWAAAFLPGLSVLPAVAALVYMMVHHFGQRTQERILERRAYALVGFAIFVGFVPLVLPTSRFFDDQFFDNPFLLVAMGLMRLALPLAVTYGLLRYSLFDIDVRVRRGVGYALLMGMFGTVYFVGSELVEGRVAGRFGQLGGLAAAALLTVFSGPLSRMTQRLAHLLMPATDAVTDAARLYSLQFAMLNEDGHVTAKERRCLDQLRKQLGLSPQQAMRLEVA